jgi:hypothetical protein
MSKFYSITRDQVIAMIEDVNESITAVTPESIMEVTESVMASISEDAVWTDSQIDVTFSSVKAVVAEWVADRTDDTTEPTRIVDDVDASYDDSDIDEALDAIREAIIAGEGYAHLVGEAEGLGVSRFVISDVIAQAKAESEVEATPIILDSDIAMAVSSMMNAVEQCSEPDAARRTAEIVAMKIKAAGGHAWINPFWYGIDQTECTAPGARHGNAQSFEYIKWPRAQVRDVVKHNGKAYRVVANYVSPGKSGQWVRQFSFYALMPV